MPQYTRGDPTSSPTALDGRILASAVSSLKLDDGCSPLDGHYAVTGGLVVAGGESVDVFQLAEEPLDQVSRFVEGRESRIVVATPLAVALERDDPLAPALRSGASIRASTSLL